MCVMRMMKEVLVEMSSDSFLSDWRESDCFSSLLNPRLALLKVLPSTRTLISYAASASDFNLSENQDHGASFVQEILLLSLHRLQQAGTAAGLD